MFGLSTWEIILIALVALIFIGPDQLPKVAKQVGKGLRQMRGAVDKVDGEVRRAVREAAAEMELDKDDDDDDELGAMLDRPKDAAKPDAATPTATKPADAAPALPPAGTTADAAAAPARDWSQAGKAPVEGRVAAARPARPLGTAIEGTPDAPTSAAAPGDVPPAPDKSNA